MFKFCFGNSAEICREKINTLKKLFYTKYFFALCFAVFAAAGVIGLIFTNSYTVRQALIHFAEIAITHRQLNSPIWHERIIRLFTEWSYIFIFITVIFGAAFILKTSKTANKIANKAVKTIMAHRIRAVLFFVFSITVFLVCKFTLKNENVNGTLSLIFIAVSLILWITTGVVFFMYSRIRIEYSFFLLFAITAFLYMSLHRMYGVPDEERHFTRAFEISRGHLLSIRSHENGAGNFFPEGSWLEINVIKGKYAELKKNWDYKLNHDKMVWYTTAGADLYPPTTYLFQIPGLIISSLVSNRTLLIAYGGRLSALLLSLLTLFFAIKLAPAYKELIFILAMTPMYLAETASLAGDSMLNSLSLLVIALVLFYSGSSFNKIRAAEMTVIYSVSILISLCKVCYLPVSALFLLIPANKFSSKKQQIIFFTILFLSAVVFSLVWLKYIGGVGGTLRDIIVYPISFLKSIVKTYWKLHFFFMAYMGADLGWSRFIVNPPCISVNQNVLMVYALCIFVVCIIKNNTNFVEQKYTKSIFACVGIIVVLLITVALYRMNGIYHFNPEDKNYTKFADGTIHGIQGRYFIPPFAILFFLLAFSKIKLQCIAFNSVLTMEKLFKYIVLVISVTNLFALSAMFRFYA